jgi:hypothetical protein
MNMFMCAATLPSPVQAYAPDFAGRFAIILKGLIDLIARRFRCNPRFAALIVPLCRRLTHAVRRAGRLMALLAAGRRPLPRLPHPGGAHGKRLLPTGRLWLIRVLGYEAAGYASQLEALFTEQAAVALFAEVPSARRLALSVGRLVGAPSCAPAPRIASPRPPKPRPPPPPPIPSTSPHPSARWPWLDRSFRKRD